MISSEAVTLTVSPFVDSADALHDGVELRRRAERDGYLFFRGLLPAEDVLSVRADLLAVLQGHGWLDDASPVLDGRLDHAAVAAVPGDDLRVDIGISVQGYVDVQRVPSMHALPHHPRLIELYGRLLDAPVFVHPRHIVRVMTSHRDLRPTPPHQDFPLIQGTPATWTCWFPLGDCPATLGSLAVLRGSHRLGYLPIVPGEGAGGVSSILCRDEDDWVGGDVAAGDVLTFPSFTVHRSLRPQTRDHVRLSMDVRYQSADEPVEARSLGNHADVEWETVYADWPDDHLQYYWRTDTPRLSPWDDSLLQPGRRIC